MFSYIPTPFGDNSPAYRPANGSLWYLWWLIAAGDDRIAKICQFPFLFITGFGIVILLKNLRFSSVRAHWAGAIVIAMPGMMSQGTNQFVDLMFSAFYIISLAMIVKYINKGHIASLLIAAVALGQTFGIKTLALPYFILLLPLFLLVFRRLREDFTPAGAYLYTLCFALIVALNGGFWYLRNYLVTGNPVFPMIVSIKGINIFPGGYTSEIMKRLQGTGVVEAKRLPSLIKENMGAVIPLLAISGMTIQSACLFLKKN